jgi:hypothetical protein
MRGPTRRMGLRRRGLAAMAASALIAVGVGLFAWQRLETGMMRNEGGTWVASGSLARSLSTQLSGDAAAGSAVQVGLSFLAKSGGYCRTFSISQGAATAGLACRHEDRWEIRVPAHPEGSREGESEYRTAGSALPPAIVGAVQQEISGEPLDRAGELAARSHDWRSTAR